MSTRYGKVGYASLSNPICFARGLGPCTPTMKETTKERKEERGEKKKVRERARIDIFPQQSSAP